MKILSLRLKNINALKGEWFIDFQAEPFNQQALFVISGATGAGKTTLLDAICLALYHRTPRLVVSPSQNELMSRHCGECLAEVCFQVKDKRYLAFWEQRRARGNAEGKLQPPKVELALADGTILADKVKLKEQQIEALTGLDFGRFTKSVLLAQGGFAAFLQADANSRAELLEELTGTEIYAHISMQVFEQFRQQQQQLEHQRHSLAQFDLLDEQQEQALSAQVEQQTQQLHSDQQQLHLWLEQQQQLLNVAQLAQQQSKLETKLEQAQQDYLALNDQREVLALHQRAQFIQPHFVSWQQALQAHQQHEAQSPLKLEALSEAQTQLASTEQSFKDAQQQQAQALAWQQSQYEMIEQALPLSQALASSQEQLKVIVAELGEQQQQLRQSEDQQVQLAQQRSQLIQQSQSDEALLARLPIDQFESALAQWQLLLSQRQQGLKDSATLQRNTAQSQQNQQALEQQLQQTQQQHSRCQQTLQQLSHELVQLEQGVRQYWQSDGLQAIDASALEPESYWQLASWTQHQHKLNACSQALEQLPLLMQQLSRFIEQADTYYDADIQRQQANAAVLEQQGVYQQIEQAFTSQQHLLLQLEQRWALAIELVQLKQLRTQLDPNQPCPLCGSDEYPGVSEAAELAYQQGWQEVEAARAAYKSLELQLQQAEQALKHKQQLHSLHDEQRQPQAQSWLQASRLMAENLAEFTLTNQSQLELLAQFLSAPGLQTWLAQLQVLAGTIQASLATSGHISELTSQLTSEQYTALKRAYQALQSNTDDTHWRNTLQMRVQAFSQAQAMFERWQPLHQQQAQEQMTLKQQEQLMQQTKAQLEQESLQLVQLQDQHQAQALTLSQLLEHLATSYAELSQISAQEAFLAVQSEDFIEQQQALKARLYQAQSQLQVHQQALAQLDLEIARQQQLALQLQRQSLQLEAQQNALLAQEQTQQTELDRVLEGLSLAQFKQRLATQESQAEQAFTQAQQQLQQAQQNQQQAQTRLIEHQQQSQQLAGILKPLDQAWLQALEASAFTSQMEFEEAILEPRVFEQLQDTLSKAAQAQDQATAQLAQVKQQLEALKLDFVEPHLANVEQIPTLLDQWQANIHALQEQVAQLQTEQAQAQQALQLQRKNKQAQAHALAQLGELETEFEQWALLNELIGSADGAKFRRFTQGLTLDHLLYLANIQLAQLAPRYRLEREQNNRLDMVVIDTWQADVKRAVKTLSGGESFLVSLALALALSELVSDKVQIDSLFLDEGFGTLDPQSLDVALDALDKLNASGKQIGVISHIEALKERIGVQLQVHKVPGLGYSRLDAHFAR